MIPLHLLPRAIATLTLAAWTLRLYRRIDLADRCARVAEELREAVEEWDAIDDSNGGGQWLSR